MSDYATDRSEDGELLMHGDPIDTTTPVRPPNYDEPDPEDDGRPPPFYSGHSDERQTKWNTLLPPGFEPDEPGS